ncbi:MAG: hypothetical protein U0835_06345 [Isosphaeraceae bacterium]
MFPHAVQLDQGVILIGSNDPVPLDPDAWRRRLEASAVKDYLGPEAFAECLGSLGTARPATPGAGLRGEVNTDLFPRDEYGSP